MKTATLSYRANAIAKLTKIHSDCKTLFEADGSWKEFYDEYYLKLHSIMCLHDSTISFAIVNLYGTLAFTTSTHDYTKKLIMAVAIEKYGVEKVVDGITPELAIEYFISTL